MRKKSKVILINIVLGSIILILIFVHEQKTAPEQKQGLLPGVKTIFPVINKQNQSMGIGMVKPDFYREKVIYFYAPNLDKAVSENHPVDSLVFTQSETGFIIGYAPPWFYPAHIKLDYDLLLLKAVSLRKDWVQVEVNQQTGQTHWVDASKVNIIYWPEFLISTSSIESNEETNPLRSRPFDHASPSGAASGILKVVEVKEAWVRVEILDKDFRRLGNGWLRWKIGDQMLITYSLLN
ncbi:MAG: hypothetical protein AAF843_12130 [Bacteroidota bacterium]